MFEVIKGSNPFKNVVIEGEAVISNKIAGEEEKAGDGLDETESPEEGANGEDGEEKQSPPKINYAELEDLREQYRREGQEYAVAMHKRADGEFEKARAEAEKIVEEAKEKGRRLLKQIDEKSEATYDEARKKGIDEGFEEGLKKGQEEGYVQGLKKCKEALMELKQLCENVEREKADIMAENRRGIFDLAMNVAEKITMTVFSQKDKNALEKMIAAAAKEFRNAKNIRVTLSKHDVSENMEADFQIYEKCFAPTTNVEFEVVDGESGTLMLENETEIFDAGVSTQLKMIEELGRGKYREKEEEPRDGGETALEAAAVQMQPQLQAQAKPETVPEIKTAVSPETIAESRSKPEPKPENKAEAKPVKTPRAPRTSRAAKEKAAAATASDAASVSAAAEAASSSEAAAGNAANVSENAKAAADTLADAASQTAELTGNVSDAVSMPVPENDSLDDSDDAFEFVSEGMSGDVFSDMTAEE